MDPDSLIRARLDSLNSTRDSRGALVPPAVIRALDPVGRRGMVPCVRCTCGGRVMHEDRVGAFSCASCRKPWPLEEHVELRNGIAPRPTSGEHKLALFFDVGVQVSLFLRSRRWRWHARCYLGAVVHPDWSMRELADACAVTWPNAPFSWRGGEGRKNVTRFVHEGRAEMSERLAGRERLPVLRGA